MKHDDYNFDELYRQYEDYMLLKNFSKYTISCYLTNFRLYHKWCQANKKAKEYHQDTVREYLVYRVKNGAKWQTMNSIYSAMRKLFREVLSLEWNTKKLPRPKKERTLPELVSKQEIKRLIEACPYMKHRAILITLYSTGMRSSELCNIQISDIDSERLQIRIRKGKGAKDRYINIPKELIDYLRQYYLVSGWK